MGYTDGEVSLIKYYLSDNAGIFFNLAILFINISRLHDKWQWFYQKQVCYPPVQEVNFRLSSLKYYIEIIY